MDCRGHLRACESARVADDASFALQKGDITYVNVGSQKRICKEAAAKKRS